MAGDQRLLGKPQQAVCGVTVAQVEVIVFDILSKLASKDVLRSSTDQADCDRGQQHVPDVSSGVSDASSGVSDVADPGGQFCEVPG